MRAKASLQIPYWEVGDLAKFIKDTSMEVMLPSRCSQRLAPDLFMFIHNCIIL